VNQIHLKKKGPKKKERSGLGPHGSGNHNGCLNETISLNLNCQNAAAGLQKRGIGETIIFEMQERAMTSQNRAPDRNTRRREGKQQEKKKKALSKEEKIGIHEGRDTTGFGLLGAGTTLSGGTQGGDD